MWLIVQSGNVGYCMMGNFPALQYNVCIMYIYGVYVINLYAHNFTCVSLLSVGALLCTSLCFASFMVIIFTTFSFKTLIW